MKKTSILLLFIFFTLHSFSQPQLKKNDIYSVDIEQITLSEKVVEDLTLLCKIWGFLKYYHPDVATGMYDWDIELCNILPNILDVENEFERNIILEKWILGFGNSFPIMDNADRLLDNVKMYPNLNWIEDKKALGNVSDQLIKIKNSKRNESSAWYVNYPFGASPFFYNEKNYAEHPFPNTVSRLIALFRFWNVIEYFFPYKYLIDDNWDNILIEFIPQFINANNKLDYKLAILKMACRIEDSHTQIVCSINISNPTLIPDPDIKDWEGKYSLPIEITFIENKAVVTNIYIPENIDYPFQIGDIIHSINSESVSKIVQRKIEYTPASNYNGKLKKIAANLLCTNEEKLRIEYERYGERITSYFITLPISTLEIPNRTRVDKPAYTVLNNNIGYICLFSTRGEVLPERLDVNGLIIDLRGYPNSIKNYWEYNMLFPKPMPFCKFTKVSGEYPGLFVFGDLVETGKLNPDYYKGKKVILVNEYTQSHAEFMVMKYKCAPNTIVLGSRTTGSDGNISQVDLPGGVGVIFTGLGVYYPDGGETQRVGIVPDIEIKPTIKGVREARDEVLEKAIELINENYYPN